MANVIGVRFRNTGKIYFFDPLDIAIAPGDGVIVETVHGMEYGEVLAGPRQVADDEVVAPLKPVVRAATEEDTRRMEENRKKESHAAQVCAERIQKHELDMKLVDVEYAFDGSKIVFFFTSEGRVDFRKLVKDLASVFHTRIELRQIGVRDEAKLLGGIGPCGLPVCCKQYMNDFHPVSIKMAKEQGLSLNPIKISGLCSRLMCCLQYEQSHYEATAKSMPKVGSEVVVPEGKGIVQKHLILKDQVTVKFIKPDGVIELRDYPIEEIGMEKRVTSQEADEASIREFSDRLDQFAAPRHVAGEQSRELRGEGEQNRQNGREGGRRRRGGRGGERGDREANAAARGENEAPQQKDAQQGEGESRNRRRRRRGGGGERKEKEAAPQQQNAPASGNADSQNGGQQGQAHKRGPRRHRGGRGRGGRGGEAKTENAAKE